nr:F-box protein SKIP23-like [Ipomoea trifida]
MSVDPDWANLPPELLDSIAKKLRIHKDYVRFRAVCASWRGSALKTPTHLPCQFPWLMLSQRQSSRLGFFSPLDDKFHFLILPEASNRRRRCGSSHGWLVILDESPSVFIINPLTRAKLNLPPLSRFPNVLDFNFYNVGREYTLRSDGEIHTCSLKEMRDTFIKKVVLSGNPLLQPNFIAMAILNQTGDLAYCKNGENSWKLIDDARSFCEDVIYSDGLFYAVNKFGSIVVCNVNSDSPRVSFIDTPLQTGGDMQYLVKVDDDFLLVTRYLELDVDIQNHRLDIVYKTVEFRVFRLDLSGEKWERVTSLEDKVLFLGENSSLALSTPDFPGFKQGNRIYFTDDYSEMNYEGANADHDVGIYNMEDGSFSEFPCCPRNPHSVLCWPPPIWITPNPC